MAGGGGASVMRCYIDPKKCPHSRSLLEIITHYQNAIPVNQIDFVPVSDFPKTIKGTPALFVPQGQEVAGLGGGLLYSDDAFEYVLLRHQGRGGGAGVRVGGALHEDPVDPFPDTEIRLPDEDEEMEMDEQKATPLKGAPPPRDPRRGTPRNNIPQDNDAPEEVDVTIPLTQADIQRRVDRQMQRRKQKYK